MAGASFVRQMVRGEPGLWSRSCFCAVIPVQGAQVVHHPGSGRAACSARRALYADWVEVATGWNGWPGVTATSLACARAPLRPLPSPTSRLTYARAEGSTTGDERPDVEYVRILHLAATT